MEKSHELTFLDSDGDLSGDVLLYGYSDEEVEDMLRVFSKSSPRTLDCVEVNSASDSFIVTFEKDEDDETEN